MKKLTVLSIVAASLLLVGCGDSATGAEAKAAAKPAVEAPAPAAAEATKEVAKPAVEASKTATTGAKEAAATAVEKTTEAVKETVAKAKDAVAETAAAATAAVAEKATEAKDAVAKTAAAATAAVTDTATKAVESTKSAASAVAEKATKAVATTSGPDGKALFAKCSACHGADGKTAALGKSNIIAGQPKADLVTKIHGYKAGTRNTKGMGALMKGQVGSYSDAQIDAVAGYISGL